MDYVLELTEVGNKLSNPPRLSDDLLLLLDQAKKLLHQVCQTPQTSMLHALNPSMKALIQDDLLRHSDVDVKIAVASCISQIMRITAPDAPYDDDQMRDVFQLIVSSFEDLADQSSRSYIRRVSILETVARVQSCVIMLDLECDGMIVEMFEHFLRSVRDHHRGVIYSSMENIMILVLKESDDISVEILKPLLATVKKHNEGVLPIARKLGEDVLKKSAETLKPYLMPALTALGDSLDTYTEIVTRVCEGTTAAMKRDDENDSGQQPEVKRPATIDSSSDSELKGQKQAGKKAVDTKEVKLPATIYSSGTSSERKRKCTPVKEKHKVSYVGGDEENLCLKNHKWCTQKNLDCSQTESVSRVTTSIVDPPSANTPVLVEKIECPLMQAHTLKVPISSSLGATPHNLLTPLSNVIENEDDQLQSSSPKRVGFVSSNTFSAHYSPSRVIASHESLATTTVVVPSGILQGSAGSPDVVNINKASSGHQVESPTKLQSEGFTCDLPVSATTPPSIPLPSMPLSSTANDSTSHFMSVMLSQFDHMGSKLDVLCTKVDHLDKSVTRLNYKVDSLHEKYDSTIAKMTTRDKKLSKEVFNLQSGYMSDTRKNKHTHDDPDCNNHEGEKRGKRVRSENVVSGQVKRSSKENTSQEGIRAKESSKQSGKKVGAGDSDVIKKDEAKTLNSNDEMDVSPNSAKKPAKGEGNLKDTSGTSSKRKRTPVQDKESDTIKYDESLVGKKVKVWWPKDKKYYEGVIKSFHAAKKKHKVSYVDGDEKNLCLRNQRWAIIQNFSAQAKH